MKKLLIVILFLLNSSLIFSQSATDYGIISFKEKLILRAAINTQNESFTIIENSEKFNVEASNLFKLQLAANYKFIGLAIGFSPKNRNSDFNSTFLQSNLQFFIKKQWIQSFHYSRIKGYYLETQPQDLDKQFPNLKTISITGTTAYNYNPKFSLKHLLHHNAWQQESAGSIIPSLTYGLNKIIDIADNEKVVQNNLDIALATSYYYTWCFKRNWFISPNISPIIGLRFFTEKNKATDNKTREIHLIRGLNLGLQYGYTSHKISTGVKFNFDSNWVNNASTREFTNDKDYVNLYFAYRIEPPGFLKRGVDNINEKLKF